MKIAEFEKILKDTIDKRITIRKNPNATDVAGVYIDDTYLHTAVPSENIYKERSKKHCDIYGTPFRGIDETLEILKYRYNEYINGSNGLGGE